jgi:hypothetical protein
MKYSGQPGSISSGQIAQLVQHLTGCSGDSSWNSGLVCCILSLPFTAAYIFLFVTFADLILFGSVVIDLGPQRGDIPLTPQYKASLRPLPLVENLKLQDELIDADIKYGNSSMCNPCTNSVIFFLSLTCS